MAGGSNDILSFDEALEFEDEIREENAMQGSKNSGETREKPNEKTTSVSTVEENVNLSQDELKEFENDFSLDHAEEPPPKKQLTLAQKARIERNRQRALMIRQGKLIPHPNAKIDTSSTESAVIKVASSRLIDTGGGFLLEEKELEKKQTVRFTDLPGPILNPGQPTCIECQEQFPDSFLYRTFDHSVCDSCRDHKDKHSLITRTDAKNQYLLKDCDLEKREPPLKFIIRKNPHNNRWGDMKLYLHLQVENRALEVWGSEEELAAEHERREEKRGKAKVKKYNKQLKSLRMNVRSSLYDRTSVATHEHSFGPESHNEEEDNYSHKCTTCGFEETFEKM